MGGSHAKAIAENNLGQLMCACDLNPELENEATYSRVRAGTKAEAERLGKYMIWPLLALERLSFMGFEGKVGYRYGRDNPAQETMVYLEFIAKTTSHIPDKGQVMVRICYFYH